MKWQSIIKIQLIFKDLEGKFHPQARSFSYSFDFYVYIVQNRTSKHLISWFWCPCCIRNELCSIIDMKSFPSISIEHSMFSIHLRQATISVVVGLPIASHLSLECGQSQARTGVMSIQWDVRTDIIGLAWTMDNVPFIVGVGNFSLCLLCTSCK